MLKKVNNKPTGGGPFWGLVVVAVVVVAVYNAITAPRVQFGEREELEEITVE